MGQGQDGDRRSVTIEGKRVPVLYRELPIDEVRLDPRNPRINYQRDSAGPPKATELRDFVLRLPGVDELFKSIRDNGGLIEPIQVHRGRAAEGNCRLAIFMRLHELMPSDSRWKKIPAEILPDETTDRQIAVLQGMHHVTGKLQWRAYLQAAHLEDMRVRLKMTPKEIAKALSLQERVVVRLLSAYEAMTTHIPGVTRGKGLKAFSYFEELFKVRKLEKFRNEKVNVKLFAKLVRAKKIPLGQNVRDLPDLLEQPKAFRKLVSEGYKAAITALAAAEPAKVIPVYKRIREARECLEGLAARELTELQNEPRQQEEIRGLYRAIKKVAAATQMDLN
jgi:hypothetical protein